MDSAQHQELVEQCDKMLAVTASAFVVDYARGSRVQCPTTPGGMSPPAALSSMAGRMKQSSRPSC